MTKAKIGRAIARPRLTWEVLGVEVERERLEGSRTLLKMRDGEMAKEAPVLVLK